MYKPELKVDNKKLVILSDEERMHNKKQRKAYILSRRTLQYGNVAQLVEQRLRWASGFKDGNP